MELKLRMPPVREKSTVHRMHSRENKLRKNLRLPPLIGTTALLVLAGLSIGFITSCSTHRMIAMPDADSIFFQSAFAQESDPMQEIRLLYDCVEYKTRMVASCYGMQPRVRNWGLGKHSLHVMCVAFSPDSKILVSGSCELEDFSLNPKTSLSSNADMTIKFWDLASGRELPRHPYTLSATARSRSSLIWQERRFFKLHRRHRCEWVKYNLNRILR